MPSVTRESVRVLRRTISPFGDQELAISAVALVELAHGIPRANQAESRKRRQMFVDDLIASISVHPFTVEVALVAGKIDAEQREQGIGVPFADLLIGATALHLGFGVLTEAFAISNEFQALSFGSSNPFLRCLSLGPLCYSEADLSRT